MIRASSKKRKSTRTRHTVAGPRLKGTKADESGLIVGIGASAGGLGAFSAFLASVPPDTGMAFILVQHLAPEHKSILASLLSKAAHIPVIEAEDGMAVVANHVFVIPPDCTLTINKRRIHLSRPAPPRERRRPIDTFFSSLAEDQGENAICIVLSGTGTDGTLGLKTIKESGGLTMAQAEFDHTAMSGMPQSAVATGLVDHVLPAEEMPAKLIEYRDHLLKVAGQKDGDGVRHDAAEHLATITALLLLKTGHDFSKYRQATLVRRIQRRMQVQQVDKIPAYIALLRKDQREAELLFRELLIGVTQFFRDPDTFAALQTAAIAKIVERKGPDETIRVWVPACSTGEEAYSITILLREAMEQQGRVCRIQVFGTDLDDDAIAFARSGRYRKTTGLSPERLKGWFTENGDEFCPIRSIREACVFSVHNLLKDPPFSKLDLISCRNLLIYMDQELHDQVLRALHYALNPDGILFLGPSEGVGRQSAQYLTLDRTHRIFQRRGIARGSPRPSLSVPASEPTSVARIPPHLPVDDPIEKSARRALARYSPVYVVIDQDHNILRFSGGETGRYLEPSAGAASLGLFNNLRKTLRPTVRMALQMTLSTKETATHDVQFDLDGNAHSVTVIVEPITVSSVSGAIFLVAFVERRLAPSESNKKLSEAEIDELGAAAVKQELLSTKAQLQATIDELGSANEDLRSITEEYQSINEELQSTNEELETSKEEMQSVNEELHTVNAEMFAKNEALTVLNSDFKNLLDSTQIATMFLDEQFCIKSFTPGMTEIFHLREGDRGRPISDIVTLVDYPELQRDFSKVLRELSVIERELHLRGSDTTFIMRIRPYRTIDNVVEGGVITFVDISARKKMDVALRKTEERFSAIVNQAPVGVAETELDGRFVFTNARYRQTVGRSEDQLRTLRLFEITHRDDLQQNEELMNRLLAEGTPFQIENRYLRPDGTAIWVHNSVSALLDQDNRPHSVLTVTLEIGGRKEAEQHTLLLLGELDHRVKNILSIISSIISQTLKTSPTPSDFASAMEGRIAAIARAHSILTDGGRGAAPLRELVLTELAPYDRASKNIVVTGPAVALTPRAGLSLGMAIHELAGNAAKYGALSTPSGRLAVTWSLGGTAAGMLNFSWVETDGPPITQLPSRQGFGTVLVERTLSHEFDAIVKREFLPSGLRCSIQIPLTIEFIHAPPAGG